MKQLDTLSPLVTVIVPVYNVEEHIGFCIESLAQQTYSNIEIILVDDGSTDKSGLTCRNAAASDRRFVYKKKENGGLSSARNYGLECSSGKYAVFVDGDDVVSPTFIQTLLEAIHETSASVSIVCLENVMNPQPYLKYRHDTSSNERTVMSGRAAMENMLENKAVTTSACGKMATVEDWKNNAFPEGRVYEDLAVVYGLIGEAKRVVISNAALYGQVIRHGSITRQTTFSQKQVHDYYLAISDCYTGVIEKWPSSEHSARVRKLIEFSRLQRVSRNCPEKTSAISEIDDEVSSYLISNRLFALRSGKMRPSDKAKVLLSATSPMLYNALFRCHESKKRMSATRRAINN